MLFNVDKLVLSTRIFFKRLHVQMRRNTEWKRAKLVSGAYKTSTAQLFCAAAGQNF